MMLVADRGGPGRADAGGMEKEHHVGIDVSLELSSVCVLNRAGVVARETRVLSEPDALVGFLANLGPPILEAGPVVGPLSA